MSAKVEWEVEGTGAGTKLSVSVLSLTISGTSVRPSVLLELFEKPGDAARNWFTWRLQIRLESVLTWQVRGAHLLSIMPVNHFGFPW